MAKAPTIVAGPASSNDSFTISEDLSASGTVKLNVIFNDARKSSLYSLDNAQVADLTTQDGVLVPQTSQLGAIIAITADGQVSYTNNSAQVEALAPGQTLQDSFLYAIRLQNGSLQWQTVTVTITGTNDAPVARADSAAVAEDAVTTGSVAGNDSDVDNGAVLTFATIDQIPAGFSMAGNGSWVFDGSNAAYQSLGAGQTQQFIIQYWVTDQYGASSSSTLTLTVTGRNDAPAAATASAGVTEDQSISGQLTATDVDQASGLTFALNEPAPAGFVLNANGSWTFDAGIYDSLGESQTQTILIRYAAVDSAGARGNAILTITVTGTNDGPLATAATASVTESGSASGRVSIADPDSAFVVEPYFGGPDGFSMSADGSWTFDASRGDYESLGEGESQDVVVDYIVTDDQGATAVSTLTITVTGENDAPTAAPATAAVAEDGFVSGQVIVSDRDANDSLTVEPPMTHYIPGLEMLSDGSWTFDANQYEYQALAEGESRDIVITYSVSDIASAYAYSTLTITITGTNDAPVTTSQWIEAAENQSVTGGLLALDQDNGAELTFAILGDVPAGLTLNADGSYVFDAANAAYDHLAWGEYQLVQVPFTVTDEYGGAIESFIMLSVSGRNDVATIGGVQSGTVNEATRGFTGTPTAQGQLTIADPDSPAQFQPVATPAASVGGYGTFTLTAAGAWSYTLDNSNPAVDALNTGQTLADYFTVHSADGSSSVVTITINGRTETVQQPSWYSGTGDPNDFNTPIAGGSATAEVWGTDAGETLVGTNIGQRFYALEGDDLVYAQAGDDYLYGFGGADTLYGQDGWDFLAGYSGADLMYGGSGDDELQGAGDNDQLYGGSGWDSLHGQEGDDLLVGGYGVDNLTGGAGADTFRFLHLRDTSDSVIDYVYGTDILDFAALDANQALAGDQAFAWGGTTPGAYSIWVQQSTNNAATSWLFADTDGNPQTAEFMLMLANNNFHATAGAITEPVGILL